MAAAGPDLEAARAVLRTHLFNRSAVPAESVLLGRALARTGAPADVAFAHLLGREIKLAPLRVLERRVDVDRAEFEGLDPVDRRAFSLVASLASDGLEGLAALASGLSAGKERERLVAQALLVLHASVCAHLGRGLPGARAARRRRRSAFTVEWTVGLVERALTFRARTLGLTLGELVARFPRGHLAAGERERYDALADAVWLLRRSGAPSQAVRVAVDGRSRQLFNGLEQRGRERAREPAPANVQT